MPMISDYRRELEEARQRVLTGSQLAKTRLGPVEFVALGDGPDVLWVHGIVGGADQGPMMSRALLGQGFRILSISRFGYLHSPMPAEGTPAAQADVYAALLDTLQIEKVALVGSSAGGPSCLQFALRHPDRCTALVLWSMAVPGAGTLPKSLRPVTRAFFGSDLLQWLILRYWPSLMMNIIGVPRAIMGVLSAEERAWLLRVVRSFFPFQSRIDGIMNDAFVSVPDLNRQYPLEHIAAPTLIIHALDDPMPPFAIAKREAERIPNVQFVTIEEGGHLLVGHHKSVRRRISHFLHNVSGVHLINP
jgi:pimeloyl-ACP methyl ester carboxylesterase